MNRLIRLDYADIKFPLPGGLVETLSKELQSANLYSSGEYAELKQAYATYSGASPSQLLAGNGLDEVIDMVTRVWGKRVLIPIPTFSQFELAAKRCTSKVIFSPCFNGEDYALRFPAKELKRASLVWICSPNNPTGTRIPDDEIASVLKQAGGIVCVDEAYYEFSGDTVIGMLAKYPNLIVLRGLSKGFGLAGLKIGFAISSEKNIKRLESIRQIFNLNRLAEKAGTEVFKYQDYYSDVRQKTIRARQSFASRLRRLGFTTFPSCTNFLLAKFNSVEKAKQIYAALKSEGVATLPAWDNEFTGLKGPFIRFSIGTEEDMEEAASRLEYIISRSK